MIAALPPDTEPGEPGYSCTIGLATRRPCGYEFAASGRQDEYLNAVLTVLAGRAMSGRLTPVNGLLVEGILLHGRALKLRRAHPGRRFPWITNVLGLPGQPPVWQAQFPSRDGRTWPGDPGYDPRPHLQADLALPGPGAPDESGPQ
jgi:hypothetical protein